MSRWFASLSLVLLLLMLGGCVGGASRELLLATTTSTQDSGLLDELIPRFTRETGISVKVIAVGSGAAMTMGQRGDADVLLVHSPAAEEQFVANGDGVDRARVMYNDFVVVGPPADPAGLKATKDAAAGVAKVAQVKAPFASRGDNSGTNAKELELWAAAKLAPPKGQSWYLETGQGMGATLTIAAEKGAYTLSDRATWLAAADHQRLAIVLEGDPRLQNVYHVIVVNPAKHEKLNTAGARRFRAFLLQPDTQHFIGEFGRAKFGQPLFTPYPD